MVGYNVQAAVDSEHHLIVTYEVVNEGNDRSQLSPMAQRTKAALEVDELDVVADRGYFDSEEILACDRAGITVTLPKPITRAVSVPTSTTTAVCSSMPNTVAEGGSSVSNRAIRSTPIKAHRVSRFSPPSWLSQWVTMANSSP